MLVLHAHYHDTIRHQCKAHFVSGLHPQTVPNRFGDCGLASAGGPTPIAAWHSRQSRTWEHQLSHGYEPLGVDARTDWT
jgi:hypothetical protein